MTSKRAEIKRLIAELRRLKHSDEEIIQLLGLQYLSDIDKMLK